MGSSTRFHTDIPLGEMQILSGFRSSGLKFTLWGICSLGGLGFSGSSAEMEINADNEGTRG